MIWATWWAWVVAGFVLGIFEVAVPGFIFLGFAIGAVVTGALIWAGILGANLPFLVLAFAVASLAGWAALRQLFGVRKGQVKIWDRDIND